jgi:hypothetical protein
VGQIVNLRPLGNRPLNTLRSEQRRLPTAAQDTILPHAVWTCFNTVMLKLAFTTGKILPDEGQQAIDGTTVRTIAYQ